MQRIQISSVVHHRIAEYARRTGSNVSAVVEEAMNEWMDIYGDALLKHLKSQKKRPVEDQKARGRKCRQPERADRHIGPSGTGRVVLFPTGREA